MLPELEPVHIGSRLMITRASILAYVQRQAKAEREKHGRQEQPQQLVAV